MTENMKKFKNKIEQAKLGDADAIDSLRWICHQAADKAPPADLVQMAQLLLDIRLEAVRKHIEKN